MEPKNFYSSKETAVHIDDLQMGRKSLYVIHLIGIVPKNV